MSSAELLSKVGACTAMAALRALWGPGNGDVPKEGTPQKVSTGEIGVPTLFVCGSSDGALLCNRDYSKATGDYCTAGYTYLEVDCGHDLLSCSKPAETQKVVDGILSHLASAAKVLV